MSTIAVVGATGNIGSRVTAQLVARGHKVRAISRNPGEASTGVDAVAADLTDPAQAVDAVAGSDAVYLTPPEGGADPLGLERTVSLNVINAAAKQNIGHLVMHSAVHGDRGDTGARVLDNKSAIERALAASGVGYTILRPAWFLQNLWMARDYLEQGVVSMPWPGDMVWAATDINDIATAAVAFIENGPAGRGFDIHIPGGITGEQIAAAASRALSKDVAYYQAEGTSREYVEAFPISDPHKEIYAELFDYFQSKTYLGDPGSINVMMEGFEPRGLDAFMKEELFAGVRA